MGKISKEIINELNQNRNKSRLLCNAPFCSIKISIDGRSSPCCANRFMEDIYPVNSLEQIWNGSIFNSYRKSIKNNILPQACSVCENALKSGAYTSAKLNQYNEFSVRRLFNNKPQVIELTLSNTCNLECVMCSGRYSSSIRKNREKLPAIKSVFEEAFRNDFVKIIPRLKEAIFVGGEPFLVPLYYDLWEDIIRLNPSCKISVVTNGTILNDKIKNVLNRGNFKINLSFDAFTKETYEKIRVNAVYEITMKNMEYFGSILNEQGKQLNIPVCPLQQNRFEIPDIVRFCNKRKYSLVFAQISEAIRYALWSLPKSDLIELKQYYTTQSFEIFDENSQKNVKLFQELTAQIDNWIVRSDIVKDFELHFDLKNDEIDLLRQKLIKDIESSISKKYSDKSECELQVEMVLANFDEVLSSLPEYFNSNHFYRQVTKFSPLTLIDGLTYYHKDLLSDIFKEWFFYL